MLTLNSAKTEALPLAQFSQGYARLTVIETWDAMGMRATASHSVSFKDAFVRADEVVGAPGAPFTSGVAGKRQLKRTAELRKVWNGSASNLRAWTLRIDDET
jgi:hypothetical protein